ncbi:MAG: alpha/beta hydrolase family protein [Pirellulaceae bacterium]
MPDIDKQYLAYIKATAAELASEYSVPSSPRKWKSLRETTRSRVIESIGLPQVDRCELLPRELGVIEGDGYTLTKVTFQTIAGIWMTGSLYKPDGDGPFPAVLCVHGHWRGAKQDPVVQARCIGLAKLGFVALSVDAFGAGERGINTPLGEYHGEMVAATLLPTGTTLPGIQVYENMRAADYLQSLSYVQSENLGITGTSGGGNQTMYAGALEERFKCVVPVCSVGNYQAYLGVACCMCELMPDALAFTEEWGVLGLTAPRGLMVINATRDGIQFSVAEAQKSLAAAGELYEVLDVAGNVRHVIVDSGHDYNQPMREAMYGWMTRFLKGEGDGSPIAEPKIETRDPESVRCYPNASRPKDHVSVPMFAERLGRHAISQQAFDDHEMALRTDLNVRKKQLADRLDYGVDPASLSNEIKSAIDGNGEKVAFSFESEPGLEIVVRYRDDLSDEKSERVVLMLSLADRTDRQEAAIADIPDPVRFYELQLRATGDAFPQGDLISRAVGHNSFQWGALVGRPLIAQWVFDIRRTIEVLQEQGMLGKESRLSILSTGEAGIVAFTANAVLEDITSVVAIDSPHTLVRRTPFEKSHVGVILPNMFNLVGDIAHLIGLSVKDKDTVLLYTDDERNPSVGDVSNALKPALKVKEILKSPNDVLVMMQPE